MFHYENAWQEVKSRIARAASSAGRDPNNVRLLAVSKTFPPDAIRAVHALGQRAFGENYVQECVEKIDALADLTDIEWHLIGPLQSNKTAVVAQRFGWVQTVDRMKVAERLSRARPADARPLDVCVQVNASGEASKSGVAPAEAVPLAKAVAALPRLRLRGLMAIPEPGADRSRYRAVKGLFDQLQGVDTLSMGMSDDLDVALAEGSTMVRIGTAIFGPRSVGSFAKHKDAA